MITLKKCRQSVWMIILVLAVLQRPAHAQVNPDSLRYLQELLLIEQVYDTTYKIWFNTKMTYRDVDSTGVIMDTVLLENSLNGSSFHLAGNWGSIRHIQDDNYRITVLFNDSVITVENRKPVYLNLFGIDLYDTLFQAMNIRGAVFTDNGSVRKMSLVFDSAASFAKYDLYYDTVTHLISKIDYHIRKAYYSVPPNSHIIDPDLIKVSIEFYDYTAGGAREGFFSTSYYIERAGGKIVGVVPYENFEIIDLTKEQ